jgi:plasmid stability protein
MKQLRLDVPDDVHRQLTARAARDGRSLHALATEILVATVGTEGDRRGRLRAKAASQGVLRATPAVPVSAALRRRILASTRGSGTILDGILGDERGRI